jgi:hypothetical protein
MQFSPNYLITMTTHIAPIRTWVTRELRPTLHTEVHDVRVCTFLCQVLSKGDLYLLLLRHDSNSKISKGD